MNKIYTMHIVDTRGTLCPQPLILTKRAIDSLPVQTSVEVLFDNDTAKCNLMSFLAELKIEAIETINEQGISCIRFITRGDNETANQSPTVPILCPTPQKNNSTSDYVVAIRSNVMGSGDDRLGATLLRAFINALPDAERIPSHILLYNSGVKIALTGMDTLSALEHLERKGVKIIACGTCLDYYEVKEQLRVGSIGNMFTITDVLSKAHHIVYP